MKNKFIKSTIILLIGGFITKLLGMFIKIVLARNLTPDELGVYMLILPTFSLLISLSQFGFPIAISKLIAEDVRNNKKVIISTIPLLFFINIFLMIIIIIFAPFISNNLLHNSYTYLSILAMSLVIPFTTVSAICRSYFFGKSKMFPHIFSNIIENLLRLIIIIKILPFILPSGIKYTICFLILINIISEIISTIVLIIFIPRNVKIKRSDLIPSKLYLKDSLKISIPNTFSRLIGSIGYFLEPVIITTMLLGSGYTINYITREYGIITGYVIPLILLPSFFTLAISQALLPIISKAYVNNNINLIKRKIRQGIMFSLLIGIPVTILLVIKPLFFLELVYHSNHGDNYIRLLAPICLFQYIQSPLSSCLDAMGKSIDNTIITIIGTLVRTISLLILSNLKIGLYALIISTSLNIIITTFLQIKKVRKYLT